MEIITILVIAFVLGIDAFSLSIGIGLCGIRRTQIYLVSATVAIFHVIMPLTGLYLGQALGTFIGPIASRVGAVVLIIIGINYLWESFKEKDPHCDTRFDGSIISRPIGLILMAGSVSLDALAVGFGLGAVGVDLIATVLIMGIVAGLMTLAGLVLGKRVNTSAGEKAELLGGVMLVLIGAYMFFW